jgi:hypothetical protein
MATGMGTVRTKPSRSSPSASGVIEGRLPRRWLTARFPGSRHFQTALAKLIDRLRAGRSFILGVDNDLCRQIAELIEDMPAASQAIYSPGARFRSNADDDGRHAGLTRVHPGWSEGR